MSVYAVELFFKNSETLSDGRVDKAQFIVCMCSVMGGGVVVDTVVKHAG